MIRACIAILGFLGALGVLLGFGGWLHPAGDSLALLRPVFAVLCVVLLVWVKQIWVRRGMLIAMIASAITVLPVFLTQSAGTDLRLYSKNLWWANADIESVVADIIAAKVDVVMLQEVSDRNQGILAMLRPEFPYQHVCDYSGWSDIAVLSRTPFVVDAHCSTRRALALAPIELDGNMVWVGSMHVPWPWPYESADNEADIAALLNEIDGPKVLAGDFNIFPWTARMQRIRRDSQTRFAGPTRPTLTLWHMPLSIDHVLAPGGGRVERRPLLGSDHRGLVADVSLTP